MKFSTATGDHPSDSDEIVEEQVQYIYLDGDETPANAYWVQEAEEAEEYVNQPYEINIEAYERAMEQATELDERNWELRIRLQNYEKELRILKRSIPQRVKDKLRYWKKVASNLKRKTKKWIKQIGGKPSDDVFRHPTPRYRDMLADRYYPTNLNQEQVWNDEAQADDEENQQEY